MNGATYVHCACRPQGFRVVPAHHCHLKSLTPLMEEVRQMMADKPVYISFDIDALDPAFAPGTGTDGATSQVVP